MSSMELQPDQNLAVVAMVVVKVSLFTIKDFACIVCAAEMCIKAKFFVYKLQLHAGAPLRMCSMGYQL